MQLKACSNAHNVEVAASDSFCHAQLFETPGAAEPQIPIQQYSYRHLEVVEPFEADIAQARAASAHVPATAVSSLAGFRYAAPPACGAVVMGRHPKSFTQPDFHWRAAYLP
jgi:hypothetical protein